MTCPPEIASILLRILTIGILRIRSDPSDSARCLSISDHLHNLPDLIDDFRPSSLAYYWNVERLCFVDKAVEEDRAAFESLWVELAPHIDGKGPAGPVGYLVVFEKAEDGSYSAIIPDLPGCVVHRNFRWEAAIAIRELMTWHVESLRRHNEPVPQSTTTGQFVMTDQP